MCSNLVASPDRGSPPRLGTIYEHSTRNRPEQSRICGSDPSLYSGKKHAHGIHSADDRDNHGNRFMRAFQGSDIWDGHYAESSSDETSSRPFKQPTSQRVFSSSLAGLPKPSRHETSEFDDENKNPLFQLTLNTDGDHPSIASTQITFTPSQFPPIPSNKLVAFNRWTQPITVKLYRCYTNLSPLQPLRKRRKVSNPTGATKESQEPVLDGPLPATSVESVETSNGTTHSLNGGANSEKDAPSAAPVAASPGSAQSLAPKTTAPEAKASAPSEENKSQAKAASESRDFDRLIPLKSSDQLSFVNSTAVPALTEVANEPSASNDESKTETANHKKSNAKATDPEPGKAEPTVSTEIKAKAVKTAAKPAEAVAVAASAGKISHTFPSCPSHVVRAPSSG
ncbi:hypothetical protein PGT21_013802 [Puccinia graminis f. sp. tritici]|uniref:Uncharacterized protein n=1 Tax=Puccinia graminis f. sp. tritici TaxID=56615 RepID=A0A5B0Q5A6_PUCGR|nr:hypothetical protein PGT21_013802 [Puccinia graminis f. sp. tritici]